MKRYMVGAVVALVLMILAGLSHGAPATDDKGKGKSAQQNRRVRFNTSRNNANSNNEDNNNILFNDRRSNIFNNRENNRNSFVMTPNPTIVVTATPASTFGLGNHGLFDSTNPLRQIYSPGSVFSDVNTRGNILNIVDPRLGNVVDPRLRNVVDPRLRNVVDPRLRNFVDPRLGNVVDPRLGNVVDPRLGGNVVDPRLGGEYAYVLQLISQNPDLLIRYPELLLQYPELLIQYPELVYQYPELLQRYPHLRRYIEPRTVGLHNIFGGNNHIHRRFPIRRVHPTSVLGGIQNNQLGFHPQFVGVQAGLGGFQSNLGGFQSNLGGFQSGLGGFQSGLGGFQSGLGGRNRFSEIDFNRPIDVNRFNTPIVTTISPFTVGGGNPSRRIRFT